MAVVKTVKPLGGGDFSSLQEWWDWAKTQETGDQWAECYGGGNLGRVDLSGGHAFTPSETEYVRIYAAPGHRHGLKWDADKAHIDGGYSGTERIAAINISQVNFTRVEGLQIRISGVMVCVEMYGATPGTGPYYAKDLLLIGGAGEGTNNCWGFLSYPRGVLEMTYFINCLVYDCGQVGAYLIGHVSNSSLYNCGFINCGNTSGWGSISNQQLDYSPQYYVNCYVLNEGSSPSAVVGFFSSTANFQNCAVYDSAISSGGWPQTDCLENAPVYGQLVDLDGDWRTLQTSDFAEAGVDLSTEFTTDGAGNERTGTWWVGPWQQEMEEAFKGFWASGMNQLMGRK